MDSEELVDLIYAALLGERTWEDFLKALSEQLPDGVATLFYHDSEKSRGSWDLVYGADASALRDGGYYASINPWMKRAATRQVGVGVISDQMLPVNELKRTEFYTDFVYGRFRTRAAVGLTMVREEGKSFLLSVLTSREDPDENARAAQLLTQLAPHLRRAFHYFRAGPKHRQIAEIAGSLFDSADVGVLVVGEGGRLKTASGSAERMLTEGRCARLNPLGRLRLCDAEAAQVLQRMLDRTEEDAPRAFTRVINGTKATLVRVMKDRFAAYFEGPTVVLLLEPVLRPRALELEDFVKSHKLSSAEARALVGLLEGKNAAAIAAEASLSRETVRTQIKSLYAKLGAAGRIDVIRQVAQLDLRRATK